MIIYLDASVVVAALTEEVRTEDVRTWLGHNDAEMLAISAWVHTEVSSALSIKVRTGALKPDERNEAMTAWNRMRREAFALIPVTDADFETAAHFADRHELGLRGGDALHVAIASSNGCALATLDRVMAAAATACSVPVVTP